MATYYLNNSSGSDTNNGTASGTPWKTFAKALSVVGNGDTVLLQTATWNTPLEINVAGTTWKAQTGHTPRLDGNYHDGLFRPDGTLPEENESASYKPGSDFGGMVSIQDINVTIDGLYIQNVAGRGVSCSKGGAVVKNCKVDFTYGAGMSFDPTPDKLDGIVIENNRVTRSTVKFYDPKRVMSGPEGVAQAIAVTGTHGAIIRGNVVAYSLGEGIDVQKDCRDTLIEDNVVFDCRHKMIYILRSTDTIIRRNIVFFTRADYTNAQGRAPDGIGVGDESASAGKGPLTNGLYIYNNLVVGCQHNYFVAAGTNKDTRLTRFYMGYNTSVAGRYSRSCIYISQLSAAATHSGIVENNVFDTRGMLTTNAAGDSTAPAIGGYTTGIAWRANVWGKTPGASKWLGATSQVGDPKLKNSVATVTTNMATGADTPASLHNLDPHNYDLTSSSALCVNRADKSRATANGTTPPAMPQDFYKSARDANPDIGMHEFGGQVVDSVSAFFTQTPSTGNAPLTVQFTDASTTGGAAVINARSWAFGDGGTSTAASPSHVYATPGTYQATLTVQDTVRGLTATYVGPTITVGSAPVDSVTANFTQSPASGVAPLTVQFTDASTRTGAAVINARSWAFGDGGTSTAASPSHVYSAPGVYQATLTVQDTVRGLTSSKTGAAITVTAAPTDSVTANFTQDVSAGAAPLTVAFTDASTVGGAATIDARLWEFGDGQTSTATSPSHVYATPGTYQARLTVTDTARSLSDAHVGGPITVRSTTGAAAVALAQTRAALRTSDGQQTFSAASLGGLLPKRAIIRITAATTDGAAADGALLSVGWTTGSAQMAIGLAMAHGSADTDAGQRWTQGACALLVDAAGEAVMRATFAGWTAGGVTLQIDWIGTPAAYLTTVEFGAGADYRAWAGAVALGALDSTAALAAGFAPDVGRFLSTIGNAETARASAAQAMGLAHVGGGQYCLERYYPDARTATVNNSQLLDGQVLLIRAGGGARPGVRVDSWGSQGVTLRVIDGDYNATALALLEYFGGARSALGLASSGTATGAVDYALGWDPQYVTHLLSPRTGTGGAADSADSGAFGIHSATADGEYTDAVAGENAAATTNEQSLSDDRLASVGHTGTALAAGTTALGTGKYTITYATAPATAQLWPRLAVEVGQTATTIVAEFEGTPLAGLTPLTVQFADLSSSTSPIVNWAWDFGDGATSTEQHPAHLYTTAGPFDVSLTVGDGANTHTRTKAGYVNATTPAKRRIVIGPYRLRPVTEASPTLTEWDAGEPDGNYGWLNLGAAFGSLGLRADAGQPAASSTEARLFFEEGELKVMMPDGTIKTITWT